MKLATWNVALPVAPARRAIARKWTDEIAADVLVLTETHDGFSPSLPYSCSSAPGRDGRHLPAHRWVTIWSKHRLEVIATSDGERTAAARLFPAEAGPFTVFGTVLPWSGSSWRGCPAAGGAAFGEALKLQLWDWKNLRRAYPDDEFFVLGDFNQDLVQPRYCGSKTTRSLLTAALEDAGLTALTSETGDPIRRDSAPCACIDHICARKDSRWATEATFRWPNSPKPLKTVSDHFGVAVLLALAAERGLAKSPDRTTDIRS